MQPPTFLPLIFGLLLNLGTLFPKPPLPPPLAISLLFPTHLCRGLLLPVCPGQPSSQIACTDLRWSPLPQGRCNCRKADIFWYHGLSSTSLSFPPSHHFLFLYFPTMTSPIQGLLMPWWTNPVLEIVFFKKTEILQTNKQINKYSNELSQNPNIPQSSG